MVYNEISLTQYTPRWPKLTFTRSLQRRREVPMGLSRTDALGHIWTAPANVSAALVGWVSVRPVDAAGVATGPNAQRRIGRQSIAHSMMQ